MQALYKSEQENVYWVIKAFSITLETIWSLYAEGWLIPPYHGVNTNVKACCIEDARDLQ